MGDDALAVRSRLIETLFSCAADLRADERVRFLDRVCGTDATLRAEIESLLAADTANDRFIASAVSDLQREMLAGSRANPEPAVTGRLVGPYRILELVGKGGMGEVYRAEREDQFRMKVALKIVKQGGNAELAGHQFQQERQILARLEHPNIARLLDGGTTAEGVPYFVMEYVEGQPITEYCRNAGLGTRARLELFRSVCAAVQYAHQNLVIHRDLKPGNILITSEGVPKLLDFGIAKPIDPDLDRNAFSLTSVGIRLMTPDYASPEQVSGQRLTTATDIYSLGVLAYELLTGCPPYGNKASRTEIERAITQDPPIDPRTVSKQIDRDLANILLMALRKEPSRRYVSVEQFSDDIRRYLEGWPILARKDTLPYRSHKFVKRHKFGVAFGALLVLAATGSGIGVHHQAVRADRRFNQVRKLAHTVLFDFHDQIAALSGATQARELLVKTAL